MQAISFAFEQSGFASVPTVLAPRTCEAISRRIRTASISGGSRNLLTKPWCAALVERLRQHVVLSALLPGGHVAIQCTYFEKSVSRNWAVPSHQDLSIPVAGRVEEAQLGGWSRKEGSDFVQPPAGLLEQLVAVRLHLEACTPADGPLQVLPGSHRLGRLADAETAALRRVTKAVICTAEAGEALAIRPLLVHASSKASGNSRRRLLHVVFGPREPGYGLQWRHAV